MKYKIVEVTWLDAQSYMGYADDIGEISKWEPIITHSCGYLLYQDKEKVILGFMLFGEEQVKHCQMIPRGMIKKIKEIKR